MATLHTKIMRDVYLSFAIHMATRPLVRRGVPLALLTYIFAKLVFVSAVFANAQAVGMEGLGSFALHAFVNADTLTLMVVIGMAAVMFGVARDAMLVLTPKHRYA